MKSLKLSVTALVASIGFVALGSGFVGTNTAKAEPRHWFYNDYGYYDGRAYPNGGGRRLYYDDRTYYQGDYYDDDDYVVYEQPRRRHKKKRKWIEKRARDVLKFATKKARKKERKKARRRERERRLEQRANRQRLYDAQRGNGWQSDAPQASPRIFTPTNRKVRKAPRRVSLAYVPLPRTKPYHLIPTNLASLAPNKSQVESEKGEDIRKISLDGKKPAGSFDDRPSLTSTVKKPVEPLSKSVSKPVEIKPIRIEIKKPQTSKPKVFKPEAKKVEPKKVAVKKVEPKKVAVKKVEPKKVAIKKVEPKKVAVKKVEVKKPIIKKPRIAANQLSCDKAKSIVSDFGFSDVTAQTCTGSVYDFAAKRDGAPYRVKVSSLSGELKGVKRVK